MAITYKTIVRTGRRITLPDEFPPGEAVEVTVKLLESKNEEGSDN